MRKHGWHYRLASSLFRHPTPTVRALAKALRHGTPETLLYFGTAMGDDLLCTAVLREMRQRGFASIWMMSRHPTIFDGNGDVDRVVEPDERFADITTLFGGSYHRLDYAPYDATTDRSRPPGRHIIGEMCETVGLHGPVALRPYVTLQPEELQKALWARGSVVVQSGGLAASRPMENKQWFADRFQAVVDALRHEHQIVQLGSTIDAPMTHATDLRGATTIRESAAILFHSRLFIGSVGFLMHLARAVDCPAVIVYGGREAPWQSGYACNTNIYTALECAPCWRWNTCDFQRRCMTEIDASVVIEAARRRTALPRSPLAVEMCTL